MRTVTGPWGSFRAWDHDILGNAIAKGEFWDQQIQSAIDEADPTGWAIDLGANIGWFTVYMAKRFAHVLAVEAHPGTYKLLVENVTSHEVTHKVTTIGGAAYDAAVDLWMVPAVWHG
jgi:tRNA/tmRNA/rRNA uracil-C5-methylase (TrmA/RlmC/RlmD family)